MDNNTITAEYQYIPIQTLNAIQTVIKEDEHFWLYCDQILCDILQLPHKGIHAPNTCITTLIKNKFTYAKSKETLKIMLLQCTVKYHETHDWIHLQDQDNLHINPFWPITNYWNSAVNNIKKPKKKCAKLTTLSTASSTPSSIHYNHPLQVLPLWALPVMSQLPCLLQRMF